MAIINDVSNYLKLDKSSVSMGAIHCEIYKSKEVREKFSPEFDIVVRREIKLPNDFWDKPTISGLSQLDSILTSVYKYLKSLPDYSYWIDC